MNCEICKGALWLPVIVRDKKTGGPKHHVALCQCRKAQERLENLKAQGMNVRCYFTLPMDIIVPTAKSWSEIITFTRKREAYLLATIGEEPDEGGEPDYEEELPF